MDFASILLLSFIAPVFGIIVYIMVRAVVKQKIPEVHYTPFDKIMGQSAIEYQVHKKATKEDDDQGDDKNKNN
ncbi:hypothetical protein D3C81_2134350 [compost metagenome]